MFVNVFKKNWRKNNYLKKTDNFYNDIFFPKNVLKRMPKKLSGIKIRAQKIVRKKKIELRGWRPSNTDIHLLTQIFITYMNIGILET